ncbi:MULTISPECIES: thermonuclease family protein [unclassified Sinorhizobium]|uniref:thermonuclease family protein n=1 Tax=unclassified Sinorhizobium TaxID=2613772 RepID=UPI0035253D4D
MRPAAFLTGLAGIATVSLLLRVGEVHLRDAASNTDFTAMTRDEIDAVGDLPDEPPNEPTRTASEEGAPAISLPETAQAAPPADGPTGEAPASGSQSAGEPKMMELPRPVAEQAGILSFGDKRVQLAGIVPTATDQTCKGANGREWPCGMVAKTALRLFLRQRTVNCGMDSDDWQGTATAECRIGSQDISTWLIENGWAEAEAGSSLVAASEKAKQAKLGLYGDDPRGREARQTGSSPLQ